MMSLPGFFPDQPDKRARHDVVTIDGDPRFIHFHSSFESVKLVEYLFEAGKYQHSSSHQF
jgi:hypothetical protein